MAYVSWENLSQAQQREIKTACVLVSLGPLVRSNVSAIATAVKAPVKDEISKFESRGALSESDEQYLKFLKEVYSVSASLDGIKRLETLSRGALYPGIINLLKKGWDSLPSVMQFTGFGSLVQHNAVSKFISFAINWRYTGSGYHAPKGMEAPFSGYDAIIDSLMGHPRCKAEMEKQTKAWQKAVKRAA